MNNNIEFTLGTGSRACGKSTLFDIVYRLTNSAGMVYGEVSCIIRKQASKRTTAGSKLSTHLDKMSEGLLLPPDLVFEAIAEWTSEEAYRRDRPILHALISGSSRHPTESKMWTNLTKTVRQIHIIQSKDEVESNILRRQIKTGIVRSDEANNDAVENAWKSYCDSVIPAVDIFGRNALSLRRSEPLLVRVEKTIEFMVLPDRIKKRILERLHRKSDPIRREIDKLDAESKADISARSEQMSHTDTW